MSREKAFRKLLLQIGSELEAKELKDLKFYFDLPAGLAEQCLTATDLWTSLISQGHLAADNLTELKEFFTDNHRLDLVKFIENYEQDRVTPKLSASVSCQESSGHNVQRSPRSFSLDNSSSSPSSITDNDGILSMSRHSASDHHILHDDSETFLKTPNITSPIAAEVNYDPETLSRMPDMRHTVQNVSQPETTAPITSGPYSSTPNHSLDSSGGGYASQPCQLTYATAELYTGVEEDGPGRSVGSSLNLVSQTTASVAPVAAIKDDSYSVDIDGPKCSTNALSNLHSTFSRMTLSNTAAPVNLREYQLELAKPGLEGRNCIICAPTGSGKTFTAAYICQQQRQEILSTGRKFKALFVVCIRNLIPQQRDALKCIMPNDGIVCGTDDKLMLSEYFQGFDVVVATAQLLVNALKNNEMRITDLNMLIMDECHHTDLGHPYNAIMDYYYTACRSNPKARLPQIIGLTASLGVGSCADNPQSHYVRICANLDCDYITHVRDPDNYKELLQYNPRPKQDQIISVPPRPQDSSFAMIVKSMMSEILDMQEMKEFGSGSHPYGTQPFENWAVQVRTSAESRDKEFCLKAAEALVQLNNSLMVYGELRMCDANSIISEFFTTPPYILPDRVKAVYSRHSEILKDIVGTEPVDGDNPKLKKLWQLLADLYSSNTDPRGILLTRTRFCVNKLVEIIKKLPQLSQKIHPERLVGQGQRDGTMTDVEQEQTLRLFRLDSDDPNRINLLIATDVAQEGLDMPKCNFVVRYNFVSNEIGSVQSKGRARAPNSECYLIVDKGSVNERREYENLEKEYMMMQALEDIDCMLSSELHASIATARERLWEELQQKKQRKAMVSSLLDAERISIHCRGCKERLCGAVDLRMYINNYICISKDFRKLIEERKMRSPQQFRLDTQIAHTYCAKKTCQRKIGLQLQYRGGHLPYGYVLSKDGVMWRHDDESEYRAIKKWSAVPFTIPEEKMFSVSS